MQNSYEIALSHMTDGRSSGMIRRVLAFGVLCMFVLKLTGAIFQ